MNTSKLTKMELIKFLFKKNYCCFLLGIILAGFHQNVFSQDSEGLFKKACSSCHTIGGGNLIGPDLQGITFKRENDWLVKFITNSQSFISSGDADAVAISKEYNNSVMPPSPISGEEINAVLSFIESKGAAGPKKKKVDYLLKATTENVIEGYRLFTGKDQLKNGGSACIACHNVTNIGNGGSLAKDITFSYNTMKGEGIKALLSSPAFPAMTNAYSNNKIEENEIYNIAAYLRSTATFKVPSNLYEPKIFSKFYFFGFGGFLFLAILFFAGWFFRKKQSVNHEIFKRQLKTEKK